MYKFEFTLNSKDSENLLGILHKEVVRCKWEELENSGEGGDTELANWYKSHGEYLTGIVEIIKQGMSKVEEV